MKQKIIAAILLNLISASITNCSQKNDQHDFLIAFAKACIQEEGKKLKLINTDIATAQTLMEDAQTESLRIFQELFPQNDAVAIQRQLSCNWAHYLRYKRSMLLFQDLEKTDLLLRCMYQQQLFLAYHAMYTKMQHFLLPSKINTNLLYFHKKLIELRQNDSNSTKTLQPRPPADPKTVRSRRRNGISK